MTLEGFCCQCATDTEIGADRRCITDGSLALPPSTMCIHARLLNGAWSPCTHLPACKPVEPGTWRKILAQQGVAVAKRERDRNNAARRFTAGASSAPKLAPSNKPQQPRKPPRAVDDSTFVCSECQEPGRRRHSGTICHRCYQNVRRRVAGAPPKPRLPILPCPICDTPFKPRSFGPGKGRRQTCGPVCGNIVAGLAHRTLPRLPCPVCSKRFAPISTGPGRNRKKYCSEACYRTTVSVQKRIEGRFAA